MASSSAWKFAETLSTHDVIGLLNEQLTAALAEVDEPIVEHEVDAADNLARVCEVGLGITTIAFKAADTQIALPWDTPPEFPQFSKLPVELQLKIWKMAITVPRVVEISV